MVAQQWLCPCSYRQKITVAENANENLTDYQVKLNVQWVPGMKTDFSDLLFTPDNSNTTLDYWLEAVDPGNEATVWLKVPSLAANSTKDFYMYFGAGCIGNSDPAATLVHWEPFDNISSWSNNSASTSIASFTYDGESTIHKINDCDPRGGYSLLGQTLDNFMLISRDIRISAEGGTGCRLSRYGLEGDQAGTNPSATDGYTLRRQAYNTGTNIYGYERRNNGSANNVNQVSLFNPYDIWYRSELSVCNNRTTQNIKADLYNDDKTTLIGGVQGTDNAYRSFDRLTIRGGRPYVVDYMAVAQHVCDPPTASFGTIDDCPVTKLVTVVDDFCEDGQGVITINVQNGQAPYTITWTPSSVGSPSSPATLNTTGNFNITNLNAGTQLNIQVTDANGCQD